MKRTARFFLATLATLAATLGGFVAWGFFGAFILGGIVAAAYMERV